MTTFETVKRRIQADMDSVTAHDGLSWANIMLKHTAQLVDEKEQHLFWSWFTNPGDADIPATDSDWIAVVPTEVPKHVTVNGLQLENRIKKNGLATFVSTCPVQTDCRKSERLSLGRSCGDGEDEKSDV